MEEQLLNKIEAYLNGDLSPQAEQQFDAEIAQNAELAKAVDNYSVTNDAIELLIEDNLRQELSLLRDEEASSSNIVSINKNKQQAKTRSLRSYLAAAASVAILLGFFSVNWAGNNYSDDALIQEVYSGYNMPNVRSVNNTPHPFAEGLNAYATKDYAKANSFFVAIVADNPRYSEAQFYLGHSFFQQKDYTAAAVQFKQIARGDDIRFIENAEWYQVLSLLSGDNKNVEFQSLLSKIANDKSHTFNAKAIQLQSKLNSFWRGLVF